jgi:hypothetical protein
MIRIRHMMWALAVFDLVAGLAFVVAGKAYAETGFITCCVPASVDNNLPAKGTCLQSPDNSSCFDSTLIGQTPCSGTFTGKAIAAYYSSTQSNDAEGCVLVQGTIGVAQETRACPSKGSDCTCTVTMTSTVQVNTMLPSGLTCPTN